MDFLDKLEFVLHHWRAGGLVFWANTF